jgi:hypothetical protein
MKVSPIPQAVRECDHGPAARSHFGPSGGGDRPHLAVTVISMEEWIADFWSRAGDPILIGIAVVLGAALLKVVSVRVWRFLLAVLRFIGEILYWLFVGWWWAKIRRAVTGDYW